MDSLVNPTLIQQAQVWAADYGLRIVAALALYVAGRWFASMLQRAVVATMTRARMDANLISLARHVTYYGVIIFVILAILGQLGIETTSLIAVMGAAGLAVGLALQGSLSNFAAGLLIVFFHPFRVGDVIEGNGVTGVVEDIQILTTVVRTFDNKVITIPNSSLTNNNIINYSAKGTLRIDMVVRIDNTEDIPRIKQIIRQVLAADDRILTDPAPTVGVLDLTESKVVLAVQPWTKVIHSDAVKFDTYERLKQRLDEVKLIRVTPPMVAGVDHSGDATMLEKMLVVGADQ